MNEMPVDENEGVALAGVNDVVVIHLQQVSLALSYAFRPNKSRGQGEDVEMR